MATNARRFRSKIARNSRIRQILAWNAILCSTPTPSTPSTAAWIITIELVSSFLVIISYRFLLITISAVGSLITRTGIVLSVWPGFTFQTIFAA